MDPGSVPPCLEYLTQVEEMLIARACPIMTVYHKHGGQRGYSGHVLNFPQNTQQFLNQLPAKVNTLPIFNNKTTWCKQFSCRLKSSSPKGPFSLKQNPFYSDIEIDKRCFISPN